MKTRSLFGRKGIDVQIRELDLPELSHGQVLVKVHACGVCGTDLNFHQGLERRLSAARTRNRRGGS